MKKKQPATFNSLNKLHKALAMPAPLHPLISVSNFYEAEAGEELADGVLLNFYQIALKNYFEGSIKYGQTQYDFNEGGLLFTAPNQLMASGGGEEECEGLTLIFHPDFLKGYELADKIKSYGFFRYDTNEALQLSAKEKSTVLNIFENIQDELSQRIDHFSQDVIIRQIELLLTYSERFYERQFITRKVIHNDVLTRLENYLESWFDNNRAVGKGLPTVHDLAKELALSPRYLSDMLRSLTGLNAQQHIHQKLIERAKALLAANKLSISEIAFQLGFEHPQSFSKLFKQKTNLSPNEYKSSLN
jgi:AraC family transcriptional regulator, transcriptional activator of pobA